MMVVFTSGGNLIYIFLRVIPALAVMVRGRLESETNDGISAEVEQSIIDFRFESAMNFITYFIDFFKLLRKHIWLLLSAVSSFKIMRKAFAHLL